MYKQISIKNIKTFSKEQNLKIAPLTLFREYWLGGGAIIDYAQIRVFSIYNRSPWRDSDLGIVDNIERAESWCEFYDPIFYDNW